MLSVTSWLTNTHMYLERNKRRQKKCNTDYEGSIRRFSKSDNELSGELDIFISVFSEIPAPQCVGMVRAGERWEFLR